MNSLRDQLVRQSIAGREEALKLVDGFVQKRNFHFACLNLWSASKEMLWAALVEWRLGSRDPSPYLRQAVEDAARLPQYLVRMPESDVGHRLAGMLAVWDAMYAQLLLSDPIRSEFRDLADMPPGHRRDPRFWPEYMVHPWESLVLELAETGRVSDDWEPFVDWLRSRRGGGLRERLRAMDAYRELIEAAHADDRRSAGQAIRRAERLFAKRTPAGGDGNWGDRAINDRSIDYRLACMIKQAERLRPGVTSGIETPHRWQWGQNESG